MSSAVAPQDAFPVIHYAAIERRYRENYAWDNSTRIHEHGMVIQHTLSGCGYYEDAGGRVLAPKGHAMLFHHGEKSRYGLVESDEPYVFRWLSMTGGAAESLFAAIRVEYGSVVLMSDQGETGTLLRHVQDEFTSGIKRDRLQLAEIALRLLLAIYREQLDARGRADPVARGRQLMESQFRAPRNLKDWTVELGISREHFTREFRSRYGVSPARFLRQLRLEHARLLLTTTLLNLAGVAESSGFASVQTFHRAYRKAYGHPPGAKKLLRL